MRKNKTRKIAQVICIIIAAMMLISVFASGMTAFF